jgi:hypothetical protein
LFLCLRCERAGILFFHAPIYGNPTQYACYLMAGLITMEHT